MWGTFGNLVDLAWNDPITRLQCSQLHIKNEVNDNIILDPDNLPTVLQRSFTVVEILKGQGRLFDRN